jgi:hypothetical protein
MTHIEIRMTHTLREPTGYILGNNFEAGNRRKYESAGQIIAKRFDKVVI